MVNNLKNRIGFGFLAGLFALAIPLILISAAPISPAHAQDSGRPVFDVAPEPDASYTQSTDAPSAAPNAKAGAKAKQAAAKRKPANNSGQPFIEFRSRYALSYGHTFVVWGRLNGKGEIGEIKPEMVAGLHPAGAGSELWTVGHMVPVPAETGPSDGDLEEEYVSNRFRVLLSEADFAKLVAHIKHKKANSPLWHAALYNCNLWTGEIAQFLGLKTGFHWLSPSDYIQKIKDMNTPGEQAAWAAGAASGGGDESSIVR